MAERNQLKVADQVDHAADDPFEELTRIMGFDPRRPDPAPTARNTGPRPVETSVEDDFGIDLEKELMGEFQGDDRPAAAEAQAAAMIPDEPGLDGYFDAAISADDTEAGGPDHRRTQSESWQASAAAPVAPGIGGELADFDFAPEDLAEEAAAREIAEVEAEPEAFDIDTDGLAKEFAQALEEDADTAQELVLGASDLTRHLTPSGAQAAGDEFEEDFQGLDLADGETGVPGSDHGDVETDVALDLDPSELDGELARPEAARAPDDEAGYSDELEAASSDPGDQWDRPAARQIADDDPEDDFPEIDLAIGDLSEDLSQPQAGGPGDGLFDQEQGALAEADWPAQPFQSDLPDQPGGAAASEVDLAAQESGGSGISGEHTDYAVDSGEDDEGKQLVVGQSSLSENDGVDPAIDLVATDEAESYAAEHDASATDAADDAAGVPAGDESSADGDFSEPPDDETFVADGQDDLPSAAAAGSPSAAAEFSLEDELNALLGNIKAAGIASATAAAAPPHVPARSLAEFAPAPAESAEDLPDFDADFEQALADGLDSVEGPTDAPTDPAWTSGDPLDALEAIAASYAPQNPASWGRANAGLPQGAAGIAQSGPVVQSDEVDFTGGVFGEPPEIETVEVADRPVALADDLDIPDLDYREAVPPAAAYDDLDAEFANLLNDMNLGEPAQAQAAAQVSAFHVEEQPYADEEQPYADFDYAPEAAASPEAPLPRTAYDDGDAGQFGLDADHLPGSLPLDEGFDPDDAFDEAPEVVTRAVPQRQRRGLLFGGIVGAVALAGGVGAFALSFGGSGSDMPALVKADSSPVKVKPENPGGTTVPNQDSAVYETVAGAARPGQPQQERLVTTAEEPIDVSPPLRDETEDMAGLAAPDEETTAEAQPKGEDRIAQILQESEGLDPNPAVAAVAPRKVRTMIVRPDGTLVPREEPALAEELAVAAAQATEAAAAPAEGEVGPMAAAMADDETGSVPPADAAAAVQAPTDSPDGAANTIETAAVVPNDASVATVDSPDAADPAGTEEAQTEPSSGSPVMPDIAPIAPQRPAQQPIDVVGEVTPDKVAAVAPSPAPAAGNATAWSVQIASQPTEAAARSSYEDLAGRYGSVLSGREVSIVKAEIAGKGTFWRVRVPADSRNDAIRLCESYKDAGGNCFVSR
jgi:hypothetical protein